MACEFCSHCIAAVEASAAVAAADDPVSTQRPSPEGGGLIGGVLSSDLSLFSDLPLLSSSSQVISKFSDPDQTRVEPTARRRRRTTETKIRDTYPPAFESQWNQSAKTGSKEKACQAWERLGKPEFGAPWKRWEACREWQQEWFNFPHVSTWLNDGRFRQDPPVSRPQVAPESPAVRAEREREERALERRFNAWKTK